MLRVLRKFNRLFDSLQKKKIKILFVLMLVGAFLEVFGVSMMLPLMNAIMNENFMETNVLARTVASAFHIANHRKFIMWCVVFLVVVYVGKGLYLITESYVQFRFVYNNRFLIQYRVLDAYQKKPYEFFLQASSGELMRIVQSDIESAFVLLQVMLSFFSEAFVTAALVIAIFVISPVITLAMAVTLLATMVAIVYVVRPRIRKSGLVFQEKYAEANKWILQFVGGMKEMKVTRTEKYFLEHFQESGYAVAKSIQRRVTWEQIPRLLIEMVCVCTVLIVITVMILLGSDMDSLIPALSAFVMAAVKLLPSANRIATAVNSVAFYEPALDKVIETVAGLDEQQEELQKPAAHAATKRTESLQIREKIEFSNITYSYPGSDTKVLENADMQIPVGKSVGIVGSSGAGKTTAVDILLGLLQPQEGQVLADGVDVQADYGGWLSHIGYIPQMIYMLDDTIRANVMFGKSAYTSEEESERALWRALEEARLADFVRELPDGLDTAIGERGIRLSGGQRQRIGIARALFMNPDILIFDEATSALDNETESAIMESINALHGKKTMVIIAHRLTTIEGCDLVYRVENGKMSKDDVRFCK